MRRMIICTLLVLAPASCGKKDESGAAKPAGSSAEPTADPTAPPAQPTAPSASEPRDDYTRPYLTDEMVVKFIQSLEEIRNPFEVIFVERGPIRNLRDMKVKLDEFNAFARKHGFKDHEDYIAVWGRISAAEIQILTNEATKSGNQVTAEIIKQAEAELKKPNLDPMVRKMYEEQIQEIRKSSEADRNEADTTETILNAADVAIVKKHQARLLEALKKFHKKPDENP
jgi:hypothetical protein